MPRYVVLRHDSPRGLHWDLMFEHGAVLKTWALPQPPAADVALTAEALPDHRMHYLDYEGPITGDRGVVTRYDAGECQIVQASATRWQALLSGGRLHGRATLVQDSVNHALWRFRFQEAAPCKTSED